MTSDTIFLKNLEIHTIIGVNEWERMVRQPVSISFEIDTDITRAAQTDDVEESINYKSISKWIIDFVEGTEYLLVERLAEEIACGVLEEFDVSRINLTVEKPGAIRHSQSVGVSITRPRDHD